jgi:hypothetical protein
MQKRIRVCLTITNSIVVLAALASIAVLPRADAAACVNKFANFTTCSFLNGVPADGDLTRIATTLTIQANIKKDYDADASISKTEACWLKYVEFQCLAQASSPWKQSLNNAPMDYMTSAPCHSDGTRLKPCYKLCTNFYKDCYTKKTEDDIDTACQLYSAKKDEDKCFGDDGVIGMKNSASASAASWAIAPLALAVARLSMSSSF